MSFTSLNVINTFWKWVKSFSQLIRCFLRNLRLNNDIQSNQQQLYNMSVCFVYYNILLIKRAADIIDNSSSAKPKQKWDYVPIITLLIFNAVFGGLVLPSFPTLNFSICGHKSFILLADTNLSDSKWTCRAVQSLTVVSILNAVFIRGNHGVVRYKLHRCTGENTIFWSIIF